MTKTPSVRDNETVEMMVYDSDTAEKPSSNIRKAMYRPQSKKLIVEFQNETTYIYDDVPQDVVDSWKNAESIGSFHYNHIRTMFPYHRV